MMESLILVQNSFYQSSEILTQNVKLLCQKLEIPLVKTEKIPLENKFLPFLEPIRFYGRMLQIFQQALANHQKLLICDTQSLLVITQFFKKLYEDLEFKEALSKECEVEIDILGLENVFVFAPEVFLNAIKTAEVKVRRWSGFRCAFLVDRELEESMKESQLIQRIESLTGLKIFTFFRESYAYLLQTNEKLAYKMGAMDYYAMVDCGVDFICTQNVSQFELMDFHSKKLQNTAGRDLAEIPILFMPQVILALFAEIKASDLCFQKHKITPTML